jgi:NAD(P)-dependent dehydrogenase (short-subunit alcohol dehydrogenase family)
MHALVTGANRGIGLELTKQLLASGAQVTTPVRQISEALSHSGAEVLAPFDLASPEAISELASKLSGRSIDCLILNAGLLHDDTLATLDTSGEHLLQQFKVNALAPLLLVNALLSHLSPGAKIALITSRMGSVGDNSSGKHYGYRMSKAALNAAGKSLAIDLKERGISVAILHPGFVRTRMTGGQGMIDADASAKGLLARIDALNLANSGSFWHMDGQILPW